MANAREDRGLPAGLQTQLERRLVELLPTLEANQVQFYMDNGRYWQGLLTHHDAPQQSDTPEDAEPDATDQMPAAEQLGWVDMLPEIQQGIPFALSVNRYHGPNGKGWTATAYVKHAGRYYERRITRGEDVPEPEDWHAMDPDWELVSSDG